MTKKNPYRTTLTAKEVAAFKDPQSFHSKSLASALAGDYGLASFLRCDRVAKERYKLHIAIGYR